MQTLKKLTRGTSSHLFKFFILLLAVVSALVLTFHSPKKIEKSLRDSGVYSSVVNNALDEAKKSSQDSGDSQIPIDDPAIKAAANKAFNPQFLQASTENFLNGTYNWLSGKTNTPDFNVDLTQAKQAFANGVGDAAATRLANLPQCTAVPGFSFSGDVDPFTIPCQPPGININQQKAKVVNDLATSKDFLGTTVLNAQTLSKDSDGQTVFDKLANVPKIYKWVNASPWLLGLLTLVFAAATVFLYDSRRRGLRNIAVALGVVGSLLIIWSLISNWLVHKATAPNGPLARSIHSDFQQTISKAINSLSGSIWQMLTWFAVAYLVVSIGILAALHFIKPKKGTETPEPPAAKPAEKPKTEPELKPSPPKS